MPDFTLRLRFAEQFGIHPDEVLTKTSVRTWLQWLEWETAKIAKEACEKFKPGGGGKLTKAERAARAWAKQLTVEDRKGLGLK